MIKKTTLEEAAEKYAEIYRCPATNDNEYCKHDIISAINFGATWRQQNSYSEEDMIDFAFNTYCYISGIMKVPFNQISENKFHAIDNFEEFKKK